VTTRLVVLALIALFVAHALQFAGVVIDDAYISFRYAQHLIEGDGLVYNVGVRAEGYSNFLWVLFASVSLGIGLPPDVALPCLGLGCGVGVVILVIVAARRLAVAEGRPVERAGLFAALLLATSSGFAFYSITGLETALFTLLLTGAALALAAKRGLSFAVLTAVAFYTRPEAALLGLVGVVLLRQATATGLLALLVLPYVAWKWHYFGAILPLSILAKPPLPGAGLLQVCEGLLPSALLIVVGALLLHQSGAGGQRRTLAGVWVLYALSAALTGPDWMDGYRLLVPSMPLLALVLDGAALGVLAAPRRTGRPAALVFVAGMLVYGAVETSRSLSLAARHDRYTAVHEDLAGLARELEDRPVESIAALDIGMLGYVASETRIVDLGGLTDRRIALAPGNHVDRQLPIDYLAELAPTVVLIAAWNSPPSAGLDPLSLDTVHPVEADLVADRWFLENYRQRYSVPIAHLYYVHVFECY
jgi:hypothetical protein